MTNPYLSDGNGHIKLLLKPFSLGIYTIIDEIDLALVENMDWSLWTNGRTSYAVCYKKGLTPNRLHRLLLTVDCSRIDHKNGDGLDNRRSNLRPATQAENLRNRGKQKNNTSGFKGVSKASLTTWKAMIHFEGRDIYLGSHQTKEAAARAYDAAAVKYFGDFAKTNFGQFHN